MWRFLVGNSRIVLFQPMYELKVLRKIILYIMHAWTSFSCPWWHIRCVIWCVISVMCSSWKPFPIGCPYERGLLVRVVLLLLTDIRCSHCLVVSRRGRMRASPQVRCDRKSQATWCNIYIRLHKYTWIKERMYIYYDICIYYKYKYLYIYKYMYTHVT